MMRPGRSAGASGAAAGGAEAKRARRPGGAGYRTRPRGAAGPYLYTPTYKGPFPVLSTPNSNRVSRDHQLFKLMFALSCRISLCPVCLRTAAEIQSHFTKCYIGSSSPNCSRNCMKSRKLPEHIVFFNHIFSRRCFKEVGKREKLGKFEN